MTTNTVTSYIKYGLPFIGGLAVGGYVAKSIGKTNKTLGWLSGLAITAFGLGWSISLAKSPSPISDDCECAAEFIIRVSALNNETSRQLYARKYGKEASTDSALAFCNNDATVK